MESAGDHGSSGASHLGLAKQIRATTTRSGKGAGSHGCASGPARSAPTGSGQGAITHGCARGTVKTIQESCSGEQEIKTSGRGTKARFGFCSAQGSSRDSTNPAQSWQVVDTAQGPTRLERKTRNERDFSGGSLSSLDCDT